MPKIPFNVSAKTARLIGRENISNLEGAISELVKNSYDADAPICIIYYEESTQSLWIMDNGVGMTPQILTDHWMTIGYSSKVTNYVTNSGRIQTGEKGIGRFALDRIASSCTMHSIGDSSNFIWSINWDLFSSIDKITDIYADIEYVKTSHFEFCSSILNKNVIDLIKEKLPDKGICFKLTQLRDNWSNALIDKIIVSLSKLLPPNTHGFQIYLFKEDTIKENAKIDSAFIDSYDYKVFFELETNGNCDITLYRNEFDFGANLKEISNEAKFNKDDLNYFKGIPKLIKTNIKELLPRTQKNYDLGKITGEIYFYKIVTQDKNEAKYFYKDFSRRKGDLKDITGIKIYRDNFIVRPYGFKGSPEFDWLDLSARRARSPASPSHKSGSWKVHNNQISGQIYLSRENKNLPDKSSREGIIETPEFIIFKEFIISIIKFIEEDRQYVIRKLYIRDENINDREKKLNRLKEEIEQTFQNKSQNESPKIDAKQVKEALDYQSEKITQLEEEMGLLRALATTGIVVNTYIHEIKTLTMKLNLGVKEAYELLKEDNDIENALNELAKIRPLHESFNSWFSVSLESIKKDKRKMKLLKLSQIINSSITTWKNINKNIEFIFDPDQEIEIRCFSYDFESIINNLITNSIFMFKTNNISNKEINIKIGNNGEYNFIKYKDNGSGLLESFKKNPDKILEYGVTDKRDANDEIIGTGLGLWIVKNIISEYKGYIDLSKNKTSNDGFIIEIYFKGREI